MNEDYTTTRKQKSRQKIKQKKNIHPNPAAETFVGHG
jgi:hypothetical protein